MSRNYKTSAHDLVRPLTRLVGTEIAVLLQNARARRAGRIKALNGVRPVDCADPVIRSMVVRVIRQKRREWKARKFRQNPAYISPAARHQEAQPWRRSGRKSPKDGA